MKHLLMKEWRLALHPAAAMFWLCSAMVLIPGYPYGVIFFYTGLGLFFICLTSREERDLYFTLGLPVRKRDVAHAHILFAVQIELIQLALLPPFMALRAALGLPPNPVGMDANLALTGNGLLLLGVYNAVFFPLWFRAPQRVGRAFLAGSAAFFVLEAALEALAHAAPFVRERLDTPDPLFLGDKLIYTAICAAGFAVLTGFALRRAGRAFERLDL